MKHILTFVFFEKNITQILFVVYSIILFLPEPFKIEAPGIRGWIASIVFNFLFCSAVSWIICVVGECLRLQSRRLFCLWHIFFHVIIISLAVSELFLISVFNLQWNAFTFQLLNETTKNETIGFFVEYANRWQFSALLVGTFFLLGVEHLLLKNGNKEKSDRLFFYARTIAVVLSLGLVSIEGRCFTLNPDVNYNNSDKLLRREGYWKLYQSILMFYRENESINLCIESQRNIKINSCRFTSPNIVLIIGETFNKHHSSLYGYGLNTNPLCGSLGGVMFDDVISPINATTTAFKYFLSFSETDNAIKWCDSPLFPAIFKSAGYNVVFYSNQYVTEGNLDYYDASAGFFNHPLVYKRLFNHRNHRKYTYDMGLIDDYKRNRNCIESDSNNLIIFHLHGQHSPAVERYPHSFSRFHEDDVVRSNLTFEQRQYVAEYDNATLYNDSVIWEIVKMYQDKDAIMVYFADHGEEVYDCRDKAGRFFDYEQGGADVLYNQLDVPFVVFETDRYKEAHPEIAEQIEISRNKPFMTDYIPHLLLWLAGIDSDLYVEEKNLFSPYYNSKRKRIVAGGTINYDEVCEQNREL